MIEITQHKTEIDITEDGFAFTLYCKSEATAKHLKDVLKTVLKNVKGE